MWHEISQYDIPDRRLLAAKADSRVSSRKDIGEARITHTIFGKARVHIIREQDKIRRARLLTALAAVALAAAAWQGWVAMNQAAPPPLSARIQVSAPAFQPEYLPNAAAPSSMGSKAGMPSQNGIINRTSEQKSAAQQVHGLRVSEQIAAKPISPQPLIAGKPQKSPAAGGGSPSGDQAGGQPPSRQSAPAQPATPVAKAPITAQPAASGVAAAATHAVPSIKEVTPIASPAGISQPSGSVNAQSD